MNINFTQTGTGAVPVDLDALYSKKIYRPEMFGAISKPVGTPLGSVPDSTNAMQFCINAMAANGGGVMLLGPGMYRLNVITISSGGIHIQGSGIHTTVILHAMIAPSSCIVFSQGASEFFNAGGISDLSIVSADDTFNKIAINVFDVSTWFCRNVYVGHYTDGAGIFGMYRGAGGTGTALYVGGREHGHIDNFHAEANIPLRIGVNPHEPAISIDSWTFNNCFLYTTLATGNCVTIDDGVALYNTRFTGAQNWIGGKDGLHWVDTSSTIESDGLYIEGVKLEQGLDATGYMINIQHNTGLKGFKFKDSAGGDRRGFYLRKVVHAAIDNYVHQQSAFEAYNIDATAITFKISQCFWWLGSFATVSGLNRAFAQAIPSGGSATIPSDAFYTTSANPVVVKSITADNNVAGAMGAFGANVAPDATLTVNNNTGATVAPSFPADLHLIAADSTDGGILMDVFAHEAVIAGRVAAGTRSSRTALPAGQIYMGIYGEPYNGSVHVDSVALEFITLNAQTGSDSSSWARLQLVPSGSTTLIDVMKWGPGVAIGNGVPDPGARNLGVGGALATAVPVTLTGTSGSVGVSDSSIIVNASGTFTLTLPAAATYPGRWLSLKSVAAQTVNSASSNVVPLAGGAAGPALFTAAAGKWANLQSDGTKWIVMSAN